MVIAANCLSAERAAVKQEAHTAGPAGARPQKVDAGQPALLDLESALLERLALAPLPRRLTVLLDLAPGDRPPCLVVGLQDQQPPGVVEDQRAGRGGDPWDLPERLDASGLDHEVIIVEAPGARARTSIRCVPRPTAWRATAWRAMPEDRIIKARGEHKLLLPELMRDTHDDALTPVAEVEQMFAAVRQQLTELTGALRSDLEELRRLTSDPPPIQGTSVLTASPDGTSPRVGTRSGVEVERKFIVKELPTELDRFPSDRISQGYAAIGEAGLEVRLRRRGDNTTLTVKKGLGRTRREEEIGLGPEQFQRLWPLTEGRRVEKVRHLIPAGDGLTIELDSYMEELDGLATAEVEFDSEAGADAFEPP